MSGYVACLMNLTLAKLWYACDCAILRWIVNSKRFAADEALLKFLLKRPRSLPCSLDT